MSTPLNSLHFDTILEGLSFQDPSLPNCAIIPALFCWYSSLSDCSLIGMDASKDNSKTAIAAVLYHSPHSAACLVPHINSVFTAEALTIHLALIILPTPHKNIIILSGIVSTLHALKNWSMNSPKVFLLLLSDIYCVTQSGHSITLIWCVGHKGIPPNKAADSLARSGPYLCSSLLWISPEDAHSIIYKDYQTGLFLGLH